MMKTKDIVAAVVERIEAAPLHSTQTLSQLITDVTAPDYPNNLDSFRILDMVRNLLAKHGKRWMDFSSHDGKYEGFPYNLDFVIRDRKTEPEIIYLDDSMDFKSNLSEDTHDE